MGYYYDPLLAIFDGWILILLSTCAVLAGIRLRGRRRSLVAGGFGLWAVATALWLPPVLGRVFTVLGPLIGRELAQQAPLLPWLAGALLVTAGVLLPPRPPDAAPGPAYPPPASARPPAMPGHPHTPPSGPPSSCSRSSRPRSSNRSPRESLEAR